MECFIVNYTQFNSFNKSILSLSRKINCSSINLTLVGKVLWKLLESFITLTCWLEFWVNVTCFFPWPVCLNWAHSSVVWKISFSWNKLFIKVVYNSCRHYDTMIVNSNLLFTIIVTHVVQETKNQTYWLYLSWKWLLYPKISHIRQFQIYVL